MGAAIMESSLILSEHKSLQNYFSVPSETVLLCNVLTDGLIVVRFSLYLVLREDENSHNSSIASPRGENSCFCACLRHPISKASRFSFTRRHIIMATRNSQTFDYIIGK